MIDLLLTEKERFTIWRKRNNVLLKTVAEYIGCSPSLVSRWECEVSGMSDEKINAYRRFIDEFEK